MKILVTGCDGFVGKNLTNYLLLKKDIEIIGITRKNNKINRKHISYTKEINGNMQWDNLPLDIDVIIHLAARAHILNDKARNPLSEFRKTNTYGAISLANQAAIVGVKRFIFISSIGVSGNETLAEPFAADDIPNPIELYAISKHEAEIGLRQIATETSMDVVIIRPPLIYGPNAPGNFARLISTITNGIPLPLGAIHNQRSFVAIDNLIDLIATCISHPAAANQTFMVSDGEDLSTTQLLRRLEQALGKPARLLPIHQSLLSNTLKLLGKEEIARRLCGSLQVDINKTRELLSWQPVISVDAALAKTAQHFLANRTNKL